MSGPDRPAFGEVMEPLLSAVLAAVTEHFGTIATTAYKQGMSDAYALVIHVADTQGEFGAEVAVGTVRNLIDNPTGDPS